MYQTLANILDSYSDNRVLLDKKALEEIAKVSIARKNKLGEYLKDIQILPNNESGTFATYNLEEKIVKFYLDYTYQTLREKYPEIEYRKKNEIIMQTILHEIRHAHQNLRAFSPGDDIEQALIRASILIQGNESYYLKNEKLCPLERLAEIDSNLQMMLVVRHSKHNNEKLYFDKLDRILHYGYFKRFNDSPSERYIRKVLIDFYFSFSSSKLEELKILLSLEKRLRLGIRVTEEEYKKHLEPNATLSILRK